MATSTRPVRATLPDRAKTFVPLLARVPTAPNHSAPLRGQRGQVGQRLDVVDDRRLAEQAADGRERRAGARHAPLALDAVDQGGLLAADERPGAHLDDDFEAEAAAEDVVAEQAVGLGLGDGRLEPLDRQGILGADVDVGLRAPMA